MNANENVHNKSADGAIVDWVLNIPSKSLSFDLLTQHMLVLSEFVPTFTGLVKAQNGTLRIEHCTAHWEHQNLESGKLSLLVKSPQEITALLDLFKGVLNDLVVLIFSFFLRYLRIDRDLWVIHILHFHRLVFLFPTLLHSCYFGCNGLSHLGRLTSEE